MVNITRRDYNRIVADFQETDEEQYLEEMIQYLDKSLIQQSYNNLRRVENYGYTFDDVYNLGIQVLWGAMRKFDGSRGSDFLSYYSNLFGWKVNDTFIENRGSKAYEARRSPYSVENIVEHMNNSTEEASVSNDLIESMSEEDSDIDDTDSLLTYRRLLEDYLYHSRGQGKAVGKGAVNDYRTLLEVFRAIERGYEDQREINEFLYRRFPNSSKDTVRKGKNRAYDRFGKYLKENM